MRKYGRRNGARVVGAAMTAFVPKNVKEHFCSVIAVIAEDPHLQDSHVLLRQLVTEANRNDKLFRQLVTQHRNFFIFSLV